MQTSQIKSLGEGLSWHFPCFPKWQKGEEESAYFLLFYVDSFPFLFSPFCHKTPKIPRAPSDRCRHYPVLTVRNENSCAVSLRGQTERWGTESCHVRIPCMCEGELSGGVNGRKRWTGGPIIPAGRLLAAGGWSGSSSLGTRQKKNTVSRTLRC